MKSFKHFYNEQKEDSNLKIRTTEAEEAGKKLILSRILAIGLVDKTLVNITSFKYSYKKDGGLYDADVTFKVGTKTVSIQIDSVSKDPSEDSFTFKHSLPTKLEICELDPDDVMQLQIISKLINDSSYKNGIRQAMISVASQIEEMKKSQQSSITESFESGGNINHHNVNDFIAEIQKNPLKYGVTEVIKYPVNDKRINQHYEFEFEDPSDAEEFKFVLSEKDIKHTALRRRPVDFESGYYKYYIGIDAKI